MSVLVRALLILLLTVTLYGAAHHEVMAGTPDESAVMTELCCENDCPDDPDCMATCPAILRCSKVMGPWSQVSAPQPRTVSALAILHLHDPYLPSGRAHDGLKRPPRL